MFVYDNGTAHKDVVTNEFALNVKHMQDEVE